MWASLNPGSSVPPRQSITLVSDDAIRRISELPPTAAMRSPVIATASARGCAGSMVSTFALTRMRVIVAGDMLSEN